MKKLTVKDLEFVRMVLAQHEMICSQANNHMRNHESYEDKSGERYLKDLGIKLNNLILDLMEQE